MGWQNGGQAQNRGGGGKGPGQANHGGKVLQGLLMAFSLYSRIPVPQAEWSKGGMRYAFCLAPLVGVVIGAAVAGFDCLARVAHVGEVARSCVGAALPLLLTGGIHMDGFLDTVDARSSCQPRERKLEILKDPHTGAFAIIGGGVYLLMYLAVFSELGPAAFPAAGGVYVTSRALSGWAAVSFPKAKKDGMLTTVSAGTGYGAARIFLAAWWLSAAAFLVWFGGLVAGGAALAAATAAFGFYYHMAMKEFGGVTGDLAGYFLQVCELGMLAALAFFL